MWVACTAPTEGQDGAKDDSAPDVVPEEVNIAGPSALELRLDSLNGYIADHPNGIDAVAERAAVYLSMMNLEYAAADISSVLSVDSNHAQALVLWGDLAFAKNRTRESRDAWTKCANLYPENADSRMKLAQLYHAVQEYEKSAKLVDRVIELTPSNPEAYFLKGLLIRDVSADTAFAIEYFQKAIDLAPDYIAALDMCGVLYSDQKNPLALVYFNRILELDPDSKFTFYNRGMYHLAVKNYDEAIMDFTSCTTLDPLDIESYFNLGYIHIELKVYREAIGYFDKALAVQPINHRALYGKGFAYELLGDLPNAANAYKQALSYNPSHQGSRLGLERVNKPVQPQ